MLPLLGVVVPLFLLLDRVGVFPGLYPEDCCVLAVSMGNVRSPPCFRAEAEDAEPGRAAGGDSGQ